MPDNLPNLIEDATLAFHGEDHDAFRAAAARLAMPLIAECEKLAADLAEARQALLEVDAKFAAELSDRLSGIVDGLTAKVAQLESDLANERAVRSRRELAVSRAIAKANAYRHSGTNAGTHGVLSEMVEILEGGKQCTGHN